MAVNDLKHLTDRIDRQLESSEISIETKQSVLKELRKDVGELDLFREGDEGFEDVLIDHLQRERERFLAKTAEDLPDYIDADEPRDEPLCTCSNSECDIKNGQIPVSVRKADTLRKGVREFKQNHAGYPRALESAAEEYHERRGVQEQRLREVIAALGSDTPLDELMATAEPTESAQVEAPADD